MYTMTYLFRVMLLFTLENYGLSESSKIKNVCFDLNNTLLFEENKD